MKTIIALFAAIAAASASQSFSLHPIVEDHLNTFDCSHWNDYIYRNHHTLPEDLYCSDSCLQSIFTDAKDMGLIPKEAQVGDKVWMNILAEETGITCQRFNADWTGDVHRFDRRGCKVYQTSC